MRVARQFSTTLIVVLMASVTQADDVASFDKARESAVVASYSLSKVQRWLHEVALPRIDSDTGLYVADGR